MNCRSFQSGTIWNAKICVNDYLLSPVRLKILLNSRGVVSQRRNERGIEHQVAFSPFPLFHSYVNRGAERKRRKVSGWTSTTSRSERYGETFAILVETFPFPGLLPPCPVNQPSEVDSVTDYTRDFVFGKRVAQRGICPAPTLSKYSQYLPPSLLSSCGITNNRIHSSVPREFLRSNVSERENRKE